MTEKSKLNKKGVLTKVESLAIFQCNCRCIMCSVGSQMDRSDKQRLHRSFLSVKKDIDEAKKIGASEFAFSGGEPTLRKDLVDLVKYAKQKRFQKIEIQSNGRIYANLYYGEKMIQAGVNSFVVSFHSSDREKNDKIMGVAGAFDQQVAGLRNLNNLGQAVKINLVITKLNYKDLAQTVSFLITKFIIKEIRFSFVLLEGYVGDNPKEIVVAMNKVVPYLKQALDVGRKSGIPCFVYNIPPCLLPGYESYVNDLSNSNTWLIGPSFSTYLNDSIKSEKIKSAQCQTCFYDQECLGLWKKYAQVFGLKEIKPVLYD